MAILTSRMFPSNQLSNCLLAFFIVVLVRIIVRSIVCNYSILYCINCTVYWRIACIETRGKKTRSPPPKPLVDGDTRRNRH